MVGHVGDHLGDQTRLGHDADTLRRCLDRFLQFVRSERGHGLVALSEQLPESRVDEWPVVEVGSKRDHHADPAVGVGGCYAKLFQEELTFGFIRGEREDLFELVDHEQELCSGRKCPIHGIEESTGS